MTRILKTLTDVNFYINCLTDFVVMLIAAVIASLAFSQLTPTHIGSVFLGIFLYAVISSLFADYNENTDQDSDS